MIFLLLYMHRILIFSDTQIAACYKIFRACQVCTPNATNSIWSECQCVLADGVERGILAANRMIPGPSIQVCQGDKVVVDVENHMEGMEVTIHWHGVWQRGSQYYDGVPYVTQCPIQEGNTFRWAQDCEFTVTKLYKRKPITCSSILIGNIHQKVSLNLRKSKKKKHFENCI